MKKCVECELENRSSAEFCGSCGAEFAVEVTQMTVAEPANLEQKTQKAARSRVRPILFGSLAFLLVVGLCGFFWLRSVGSIPSVQESLAAIDDDTETTAATDPPTKATGATDKLNSNGVPMSCDAPTLMALANDILISQMGATDQVQVMASGYDISQVDSQSTGVSANVIEDPSKFAQLICSYSSGVTSDGLTAHMLTLNIDSESHPTDWRGSIDEVAMKFNAGEKAAMYYPSGSGYENGGGLSWIIWVGDKTLQVDTWSPDGAHGETLNTSKIGKVVQLLKAGK